MGMKFGDIESNASMLILQICRLRCIQSSSKPNAKSESSKKVIRYYDAKPLDVSIWLLNCKERVVIPLFLQCILEKFQREPTSASNKDESLMLRTSDMANISVGWEVDGIITVEHSVASMLKVIATTTPKDTGRFLTWDGRVSDPGLTWQYLVLTYLRNTLGRFMAKLHKMEICWPDSKSTARKCPHPNIIESHFDLAIDVTY